MLASFWQHPAVLVLVAAVPSVILGYFGLRRAFRADKVAEQAGISTAHHDSIGQVVDGLNTLNDKLQKEVERLDGKLATVQARLDLVETGSVSLVAKNLVLEQENEMLHAELAAAVSQNDELKLKIGKLEDRIATLENNTTGGTP